MKLPPYCGYKSHTRQEEKGLANFQKEGEGLVLSWKKVEISEKKYKKGKKERKGLSSWLRGATVRERRKMLSFGLF